jgi:hypothetical protein
MEHPLGHEDGQLDEPLLEALPELLEPELLDPELLPPPELLVDEPLLDPVPMQTPDMHVWPPVVQSVQSTPPVPQ